MQTHLPSENLERSLVQACKKQDRKGQHATFNRYSGKMMAVCRRYLGNGPDAEDALMEGFMKVFSKVETFNEAGSFEGWIRRIVVNECLMKIRKQGDVFTKNIEEAWDVGEPADALMHLRTAEIEAIIAELPPGYRMIFKLYAIEGYSHEEIATLVGISSGTSKSQLSRARTMIQQKIKVIES
ncbi:MAG: RNA polymerase sigma factor [Cytophagaceae bacterium]|nr:RNA polymerase sigma factor [Cytophagaceae bacterium]MBP6093985.1 RNA polymerase sigma factor [Cytophagaceae bacterium]